MKYFGRFTYYYPAAIMQLGTSHNWVLIPQKAIQVDPLRSLLSPPDLLSQFRCLMYLVRATAAGEGRRSKGLDSTWVGIKGGGVARKLFIVPQKRDLSSREP